MFGEFWSRVALSAESAASTILTVAPAARQNLFDDILVPRLVAKFNPPTEIFYSKKRSNKWIEAEFEKSVSV